MSAYLDRPSRSYKQAHLESYGFEVGARNPQLNTNYPGQFMVTEGYDQSELPTADGSNGPWCITGDDLDELITEAYDFLTSLIS
jgi:hypothetical protein